MSKFTKVMVSVLMVVMAVNMAVVNRQILTLETESDYLYAKVDLIADTVLKMGQCITPSRYMVAETLPKMVKISVGRKSDVFGYLKSTGSGVIIGDGLILTCKHVVSDFNDVSVTLFDGVKVRAKKIAIDQDCDLALVMVDYYMPNIMEFSTNFMVGDPIFVFGCPYGYDQTVTRGIVSRFIVDPNLIADIQIDAPINPGNSGGPTTDQFGRMIGIVKSITAGSDGIGFIISVNKINKALPELLAKIEAD